MQNNLYLVRHALQTFSELEFAKKLKKKYFTFFPFRDEGIDIMGIDKKNPAIVKCFQVKARNKGRHTYQFRIDKKSFSRTKNVPSMWYVFVLVDNDRIVDHIVIPVSHLKKWMKIKNPDKKIILWVESRNLWRFDINHVHKKGSYYVKPKKGKMLLDNYVLRGERTAFDKII